MLSPPMDVEIANTEVTTATVMDLFAGRLYTFIILLLLRTPMGLRVLTVVQFAMILVRMSAICHFQVGFSVLVRIILVCRNNIIMF